MFLLQKLAPCALLLLSSAIFVVVAGEKTAQEVLAAHGLPANLLPDEVAEYSLHENGHFKVKLQGRCYVIIGPDRDEVCYDSAITGVLQDGSLSALTGITTRKAFLWLRVTSIYVDKPTTGWIHFEVGFVSKAMQLSVFDRPPTCGRSDFKESVLLRLWTEVSKKVAQVIVKDDEAEGMEER